MRITFSPLIATASGKAADAVASSWKGRAYIRKLVIPHNPQSTAQTLVRNSLARCVTLWRSLETLLKTWLDTYGIVYRMSGYNVFVQKNRVLEQAEELLKPVPDNPHCPAPGTFAAVTGVGAAGDIDVTWVDNAPTDWNHITLFVRKSAANIFEAAAWPLAVNEAYTFSGLATGTEYDVYGFFHNDTLATYGTSAGVLDVTSMA